MKPNIRLIKIIQREIKREEGVKEGERERKEQLRAWDDIKLSKV